jgi:ABC-type lipoprotein release transport system permease subunit
MALDPGAGRTAVPVRTTVFGAAITLVALASALAFGASLTRLENTPALSGQTWDTLIFVGGTPTKQGSPAQRLVAAADRSPAVAAYSLGSIFSAKAGGSQVTAEVLDPQRGDITPALIEGRLPQAENEVALGTQTMQDAKTHIGGFVTMSAEGGPQRMRVVGRIAMPNLFFSFTRPGQGAAMTKTAAERIAPRQNTGGTGLFLRFAPGADVPAFESSLKKVDPHIFVVPQLQSAQLSSLNEIGRYPLILAGILALMAIATLGHTLITSIRRRRHDLAILKTLGFVRGQVSATVAWQATTFGVAALVIGIPIGVIAGRWGWNVFADHLGVVPDAVLPAIALLVIAPATIVVANLLALVPGRIASRLRPATVLRTE